MLVARVILDHNVVHVNLYASTDHSFEDFVHQALVGRPRILQNERHYLIEVVCTVDREGCFLFVTGVHAYLVVARISVQEAQYFVPNRSVNESIDVRQRV